MKKYKLKWTPEARADLRAIKRYIAQHAPRVAVSYVKRIGERCEKLVTFPFAAPIVAEFGDDHLRETYHGNYRIIYEVENDLVTILRIFHGARQLTEDELP